MHVSCCYVHLQASWSIILNFNYWAVVVFNSLPFLANQISPVTPPSLLLNSKVSLTSWINCSMYLLFAVAFSVAANSITALLRQVGPKAPIRPRGPRGFRHDVNIDISPRSIKACNEEGKFFEAHLEPEMEPGHRAELLTGFDLFFQFCEFIQIIDQYSHSSCSFDAEIRICR